VVVPEIAGNMHTPAFREIAETVHYALIALGHDSMLAPAPQSGLRNIIFGAHLFDPRTAFEPESIFYTLEQVGGPLTAATALLGRYEVWDYSARNVALWLERGVRARHVPVGYVPELTRIPKAAAPDIDVIFYGAASPRRARIIQALAHERLVVRAFGALYGPARDQHIGRSKVVLNLSRTDEHRVFEVVRVSYALANAMCVVSEGGPGDEQYRDAAVIRDYDGLVEACVELARDDARREAQGRRGLELMKSMPETEILRGVL
jgi:hypothetical protein